MSILQKSPIADIVTQMASHYGRGNVVEVVQRTLANADKDLGIGGTLTEKLVTLVPEPFVNAVNVNTVNRSGGAFRFSDLRMTVSRDSLDDTTALSKTTQFVVNGRRYGIISVTPGPSAWEFTIRALAAEPVTP